MRNGTRNVRRRGGTSKNSSYIEKIREKITPRLAVVQQLDEVWTKHFAVCRDTKSAVSKVLRPCLKTLEISFHGIPWLAATLYFIFTAQHKTESHFFVNLMTALLLDLLVVLVVKVAVRRSRPPYNIQDTLLTVKVDDQYSFPSGHSTRAIMVCCLFLYSHDLQGYQQMLLCLWSCVTAISRILLGRHYITDVLAGVLIGLIQSIIVTQFLWLDPQEAWAYVETFKECVGAKQNLVAL